MPQPIAWSTVLLLEAIVHDELESQLFTQSFLLLQKRGGLIIKDFSYFRVIIP